MAEFAAQAVGESGSGGCESKSDRRPTFKQRIYKATKEFAVMALYLWLIFGLFSIYRSVILAEDHITVAEKSFALVNALVLAKVMLVAKELRLGELVSSVPLIYPNLVKSALFSVVLALSKILEEAATGLCRGRSFQQSIADLGGGTLQGIPCLTLLLFVMLIPFFGFTELQAALGEGKLLGLFFRSGHKKSALPPRPA